MGHEILCELPFFFSLTKIFSWLPFKIQGWLMETLFLYLWLAHLSSTLTGSYWPYKDNEDDDIFKREAIRN